MTRYPAPTMLRLLELGNRSILPCANIAEASVQVVLAEGAAYSDGVLTIKGTLDGTTWFTLGEPTITADALRGPLYVRGLYAVCVEVTTVSSALREVRVAWSAVECC